MIDLHGLYAAEVQAVMDGLAGGRWCVVVGKGNHSGGKMPVLGKEVRRLANERGWGVEEVQGNQGRLWIDIPGGQSGHGGYGHGGQGHGGHHAPQQPQQPQEEEKSIVVRVLEALCSKACTIM